MLPLFSTAREFTTAVHWLAPSQEKCAQSWVDESVRFTQQISSLSHIFVPRMISVGSAGSRSLPLRYPPASASLHHAAAFIGQAQWRPSKHCLCDMPVLCASNKCIGDDTKAAARQSLNCIKNKNSEKRFSTWRMEFLHPAMWYVHDIDFARWLNPATWHVSLESWEWIHQSGSTLQCDTCLSDDMPLNSPKRPP